MKIAKRTSKVSTTFERETFCKEKLQHLVLDDLNAEIRLGISIADEKANRESIRRRMEAPLTTEEKLFAKK